MSKNLEAKLGALLNDIEQFTQHDKLLSILQFLKTEMELMEKTRLWNQKDLTLIQTRAKAIMFDMGSTEILEGETFYQNHDLIRTYCIAQAAYEYMRGQGLTPYVIGIQRQKSKTIQCDHSKAALDPLRGTFHCPTCRAEVRPLMWTEVKKSQ
jgi:hypothetical protein